LQLAFSYTNLSFGLADLENIEWVTFVQVAWIFFKHSLSQKK